MITVLAETIGGGDGYLIVRCQQKTSCGSCASKNFCGTGVVSNTFSEKILNIRVPFALFVSEGTMVEIGFEEQTILKFAAIVYIFPLFFMIVGACIGQLFAILMASSEGIVILSFISAGGIGVIIAHYFSHKLERDTRTIAKLIHVFEASVMETVTINATTEDSD
ncbi:SoxR reducing system RseC family protein [Candidatus Enterovibrio altilux]|uniref:Sigma factor RpoE regulatory protein RseC n=1 Tax=Candidatus Enterovibrio altilux TaxID=1927128 RepID=A0A291B9S7_9GAMM|nr:SoxR reducing system RseC family protein [Candidatus Enterovibrio luxaltus]ATF09752.1 Sigma factor RpoE regulatory protein RseC [Candidatus Enterovibrio luxaltus]